VTFFNLKQKTHYFGFEQNIPAMPLSKTSRLKIKWEKDGTVGLSASRAQIQKL
jgi:hypothetical protein